jgi:septum formation topological specificity factor MinE
VTRGCETPRWILAQTRQERVVVWTELLKLVKIVPVIRKYIRVPDGTRINKQTNKQTNKQVLNALLVLPRL